MRTDVPANLDAVWRAGNFTGANRPRMRVTIQRPLMRRDTFQMRSTFRRVMQDYSDLESLDPYPSGIDPMTGEDVTNIYNSHLFASPASPKEFAGVQSIQWARSDSVDVAECTVTLANNRPLALGEPSPTGDFDQPGFYTPGRGRSGFSGRWHHLPNEYADLLQPDNLMRTYEGYGWDPSVAPEDDPHLTLTGVWLIDDALPSARGGLQIKARDAGRLLMDHLCWVPVVPEDMYPVSFEGWGDKVGVVTRSSNIEQLHVTPVGSGNDFWPETNYGAFTKIYGHRLADAFDGNSDTYWLSIGNDRPTRRYAYEYVDFALDSATVDRLTIRTVKDRYNVYVSVQTGGGWLPGSIMGYHRDGQGRYEEGVPYVAALGGIQGEGPHTIELGGIQGVTLIRVWLGNLPNFALPGTGNYRGAIRDIAVFGPVQRASIQAVSLTPGPAGSNPGRVQDYTDIVKLFCAWAGLYWPGDSYVWHSDGSKHSLRPATYDPVLGSGVTGRVWGDFESTGTTPVAPISASNFDQKPLMDGVRYVADIIGFRFAIDETGGAVWRLPNVWALGNWIGGMASSPGRTRAMLTIDERVSLTDLDATLTSRNVREGIFVGNVTGQFTALVGGFNPNPTGLMRMAGWTDQNFSSLEEAQVMADLIAVRQMFSYRTDTLRIPGHPGLQVDDQVRVFERTTSEGFVHYVQGVSSMNDAASGKWEYTLQTHWLGDDPNGAWAIDRASLNQATVEYVDALVQGADFSRGGLGL